MLEGEGVRVWIVNPFDNLPQEGTRPQRYWLMARAFVQAGHEVVYWTSDFSHTRKQKRVLEGFASDVHEFEDEGIHVKLIPTKPYAKNVCLKRIWSHTKLATAFAKLAKIEQRKPQLVVASTPPLGLCHAAMTFAKKSDAKFICDIQDAWPETFERVVPGFMLAGLRETAKRLYCGADAITATGSLYTELAASYGSLAPAFVFGPAIEMRPPPVRSTEDERKLKLAYCGNMSLSYDLATLIKVVKELPDATLDLAGEGPSRSYLEELAADCDRIRFHGYLSEGELAQMLDGCTVGVIPMFPESCVAVPGKLADYAAARLRVVECLGGECATMVDLHAAGTHYEVRNPESLKVALHSVLQTTPNWEGFRSAFDGAEMMTEYVKFAEGLLVPPRRIFHVAGSWEAWSGVATVARMIAQEQIHEPNTSSAGRTSLSRREIRTATEVWVHCAWLPCLWWATLQARLLKKPVCRMPHGSYDPVRLAYHGWKKKLVSPIERFFLRRATKLIATCPEEADWIRAYVGKGCPPIEVTDLKRFFRLDTPFTPRQDPKKLHVMYLGRVHSLKGLDYLGDALAALGMGKEDSPVEFLGGTTLEGEELEKLWAWGDVLVLPTLSENFGLVVAEALSRGKHAITTDGAPAWKDEPRVVYLEGYRDGTPVKRVELLKDALSKML